MDFSLYTHLNEFFFPSQMTVLRREATAIQFTVGEGVREQLTTQ